MSDEPDFPDADGMLDLRMARERAIKLVADLEEKARELEGMERPDLTPEQVAMGKLAMQKALEASRRMLESLQGALDIAEREGR